jgi:hypothetical protein
LEGLNLSFKGSNLSFKGSNLSFDGLNLSFRLLYRITNKTNTSNNTKIVLASQKRHLGRLARPNRADAGRISKGKEENRKKQKHQNRERGRRGQTINLVTKLETAKIFSKIRSIY